MSAQIAGELAAAGVNGADGDVLAGVLDRELQVAVAGDHDRRVDPAARTSISRWEATLTSEPFYSRSATGPIKLASGTSLPAASLTRVGGVGADAHPAIGYAVRGG